MKLNTPQATFDRLKRVPLNLKQVNFSSFKVTGIDVVFDRVFDGDAYIAYAELNDGRALTDDQLEQLNELSEVVSEAVANQTYWEGSY